MSNANQGCNHAAAKPWIRITIDVKSGNETPFGDLMWCPDCHRGFTRLMPSNAQIAQHYDLESYYTQGNSSHMPDISPTLADRVLTKLAWTFDSPPAALPLTIAEKRPGKGRLLDIGCGKGDLMADAQACGFDVMGVDPDPAARKAAANAGMVANDGTAEHLPDNVRKSGFRCRHNDACSGTLYIATPSLGKCA